jgi:hypothetical protein
MPTRTRTTNSGVPISILVKMYVSYPVYWLRCSFSFNFFFFWLICSFISNLISLAVLNQIVFFFKTLTEGCVGRALATGWKGTYRHVQDLSPPSWKGEHPSLGSSLTIEYPDRYYVVWVRDRICATKRDAGTLIWSGCDDRPSEDVIKKCLKEECTACKSLSLLYFQFCALFQPSPHLLRVSRFKTNASLCECIDIFLFLLYIYCFFLDQDWKRSSCFEI